MCIKFLDFVAHSNIYYYHFNHKLGMEILLVTFFYYMHATYSIYTQIGELG